MKFLICIIIAVALSGQISPFIVRPLERVALERIALENIALNRLAVPVPVAAVPAPVPVAAVPAPIIAGKRSTYGSNVGGLIVAVPNGDVVNGPVATGEVVSSVIPNDNVITGAVPNGDVSAAPENVDEVNGTICTLSTDRSVISCVGLQFNFECPVVANLTTLGSFEHRVENLRTLPEGFSSINDSRVEDVRRIEIVSLNGDQTDVNDFTFVHRGQKVILTLYSSEGIHDLGFRFVDKQCWRNYVDMLRTVTPLNVRFVLNVVHA
jgi:hypothetical protein